MQSQAKHTPEPWSAQGIGARLSDNWWITAARPATPAHVGTQIARVFSANPAMGFADAPGAAEAEANARRIVACVNACAGIPTEALETGAFGKVKAALAAVDKELERLHYDPENSTRILVLAALASLRGEG